ncbi:MAG: flagellar export chaperone FliS [Rubrivivax sp.]
MFSSSPTTTISARPGRIHPFAGTYRQVGHETGIVDASPHRLVAMLFDGCLDAIAEARCALRSSDVAAKASAVSRAARIVDEGLRGALDLRGGGPLAADLDQLYAYLAMQLTMANLRNDEATLEQCQRLLAPLRDAWTSIAPRGDIVPSAR